MPTTCRSESGIITAMAEQDRARWNRRYRDRYAARPPSWTPSAWLVGIEDHLRPPCSGARALDLACGIGRHALWLAERGWTVDAWDASDVAVEILNAELERRARDGRPLEVTARVIDLDDLLLQATTYDLVANVFFLDRRLWGGIASALKPGGLLAFETFVAVPGGRRSEVSPEHLLQPGELRSAFERLGLEIVAYAEEADRGAASLLARKPDRAAE